MIPPFVPHPLARGGHLQSILATLLPVRGPNADTKQHRVTLADGDQIVLHDDCPPAWEGGHRVVLLVHGLCGCHQSNYMLRIAAKLVKQCVRVFRMDLRGSGAGVGLAKRPYNAGRSEDAFDALRFVISRCPGSPVCMIGFSLGGNIVLKLLGESPAELPAELDRAAAVSPVIDLALGVDNLSRGAGRFYDRYFTRQLNQQIHQYAQTVRDELGIEITPARNLRGFDDFYTAPLSGYRDAADYYSRASSQQFVSGIRIPTFVLASEDDPVVPVAMHQQANWPACVQVHLTSRGGHVAFLGHRANGDPDRRWVDWRIIDWVTAE